MLWHVAGGWLTNVILIVQGFLLIPLYLHFLGDRLYGFWLATGGMLAWLTMADLGASAVTSQRCAAAYGRNDFEGVADYFWHGLAVMLLIMGMVVAGTFWIAAGLIEWLKVDSEYAEPVRICFLISGAGVAVQLANDFLTSFCLAMQRSRIPVVARSLSRLLGLIGIVVALVVLEWGLYSLIVGVLLRTLLPFCVIVGYSALILFSIGARWRWSAATFRDYLVTTPSVLAAKSSGQFARNLPQVLLGRLAGPEATVAYTVSLRVIGVAQGFIGVSFSGLFSACSHLISDSSVSAERERSMVGKITRAFVVAASVGGTLYALFNHGFVSLWTSEEQFAGQLFTSASALASFFFLRSNLYVGLGMAMGRINTFESIQTVENLIQAGLFYLAIERFGVVGVPFAIIASSLLGQLGYLRAFRRSRNSIDEGLRPLAWIWIPVACVYAAAYFLADIFRVEDWFLFVFYCSVAALPFALVFYFGMPGLRDQIGERCRKFHQRTGGLFGRLRLRKGESGSNA